MNKSELIRLIVSKQPHLSFGDVNAAVTQIINKMIDELANGGRIEIRNFGAFSIKQRKARMARNPKTGERVYVLPKQAIHFKPGTNLRACVNASATQYRFLD